MRTKTSYQTTIYACYLAYIVQGIINNISPLLFVIYRTRLGLSLGHISFLIAANFGMQILIDLLAANYADRLGYRFSMILAHVLSVLGLLGIGLFPLLFPVPFAGLLLATLFNAIGGGLIEVLVSPIVEAAPGKEKEKAMSLLHSFYCWGCVGFILLSTLLLHFLGAGNWFFMPVFWAVIPLFNCFLFAKVPIRTLSEKGQSIVPKSLFSMKSFWILVLLMTCAGASEMAMSQWASYFAELGLGVEKAVGDLLGPCLFCFLMGAARLFFGKSQTGLPLTSFMKGSCLLCIASYLLAVFSPHPLPGLLGCGLCGLSVGILWPGTFSIAAKICRSGDTALFAFLALAGDLGCVIGPQTVSLISRLLPEAGLKAGLLAAAIFPLILLLVLCLIRISPEK